MSRLCPACRWPVRADDLGALVAHPRFDTGEPCEGAGTVAAIHPSTAAGLALVARLRAEEHAAAVRADDDEMHTHARVAAKAERDLMRRLLRWVPEEIDRAEREAAEANAKDHARMSVLLEGIA